MPATADPQSAAEALLALLKREHEALLAGDLERIEAIVPEKHTLAARLDGMVRGLAIDPVRDARLHELALACRRQNDINGGMVAAGLRHTQHLLALLRGQSPDRGLYTRAGQTEVDSSARPLASA